ncbi:ferrous iron transport protein B [Maridesulfovibrio salexigens]|uniref:Ferrous iron transport protein B n=1 Tax=Maridesulfovibrio salexigens (strain ATCC 14822 / DSM 2638 / NCIMB 8403 / VKM B-1763) TaxID=526222 RepID=C6BS89_MARSD|nr:ferrous iron transport protein B [Maridesulfovibrio salexigens]ACS79565.1 ferrous iron transport protein B [Maridesulfovibrio salexigens DSM 2638]
MHRIERIAIAGVPNSGKTTLFNALTGARQKVGNWPGVTVEKIEGTFSLSGTKVELVDLPGTYNLSPDTEDQKVAERVIRSGEYDMIVNVVDATNLSRNLFLTMDLKERTDQIVILLNMLDVAESEGLDIDVRKLSKELGIAVIPVIAVDKDSVERAVAALAVEAQKLPEHDSHPTRQEVMDTVEKYNHIDNIYSKVLKEKKDRSQNFTNKVDNIVMNKFAAIPVFLISMFLTFWFAIGLGSVFIDFFDIMAGLIFIDIPADLLSNIGAPEWVTVTLGGIGAGIQTVATFIPVVFFMFLALAILEDFGYMARVAVVADRFMRKIGLPGSAFIPMVVGFGCTVPAVMSARTLTSKRDRFMTIFMAPFMSCGARLPVYALFCVALFGAYSGLAVFLIYLSGLAMAIFTGFLLKNTLFKGSPSHFVMDLPLYHIPRISAVFKSAWLRMKGFVKRAGVIVVTAVFVLSMLNSVGIDNGKLTFGNEDSQNSVLSIAGKSISPVFKPMGIEEENWPASVALFTGLFAKEAIVGTVNSLYASIDDAAAPAEPAAEEGEEEGGLDIGGTVNEAFGTVVDGLVGVVTSVDLLGIGLISEDSATVSEEIGADASVYKHLAANFTVYSAFAYLLFVLMYFPCLAVIGATRQEMGGFYSGVMAMYCTALGWSVATLFYQIAEGRNPVYAGIAIAILAGIYATLKYLGNKESDKLDGLQPLNL